MVRLITILCIACLSSAIALVLSPNSWAIAGRKASDDATTFAALIDTPDKISWGLTQDAALLRAVVWDANGRRLYPPPEGMHPAPYELSDVLERQIGAFHAQTEKVEWAPFDMAGHQLLSCRDVPSVCLVYDRQFLEDVLELRPGSLSSGYQRHSYAIMLAVLPCLFGGTAIWLNKGKSKNTRAFELVPERHIAIRDELEVQLTPRDLKLLAILQTRDGAVVTKDELYDAGRGRDYMPNSRSLDQHIINLRRKLDSTKSRPVMIETVHGVGYRLVK